MLCYWRTFWYHGVQPRASVIGQDIYTVWCYFERKGGCSNHAGSHYYKKETKGNMQYIDHCYNAVQPQACVIGKHGREGPLRPLKADYTLSSSHCSHRPSFPCFHSPPISASPGALMGIRLLIQNWRQQTFPKWNKQKSKTLTKTYSFYVFSRSCKLNFGFWSLGSFHCLISVYFPVFSCWDPLSNGITCGSLSGLYEISKDHLQSFTYAQNIICPAPLPSISRRMNQEKSSFDCASNYMICGLWFLWSHFWALSTICLCGQRSGIFKILM